MTEELSGPAKYIEGFFSGAAVFGRMGFALAFVIWAAYNVGPTAGLISVICTAVIILAFITYFGWQAYKDYKAMNQFDAWLAEENKKHPETYKGFLKNEDRQNRD